MDIAMVMEIQFGMVLPIGQATVMYMHFVSKRYCKIKAMKPN